MVATLVQGGASVVLGQVLLPADFGLVNFATIITNFVARFNDMGLESAVIQRASIGPKTLSTAFSLKLAASTMMLLLLWVSAGPLASMLGSPQASPVIRLLSVTFLLSALSFVPMVRLRKELKYDAIAVVWIASTLLGAICSIVLALGGAGYWSIVAGQVVATLTTLGMAQWLQPSVYTLSVDRDECRQLIAFGGRVFLSGVIVFACFNIDNLAIGIKLGATALGLYGIAFNWSTQICSFASSTILTVLFPAFTNLGADRDSVRALYVNSIRQLGMFGALAYGLFALVTPEFIVLVLGRGTDKWLAALPVLQVFCVYGIIRLLLEPLANVLLAVGRADLLLRSAVLTLVIELMAVAAVLYTGGGIIAVAWSVLVAYALQYLYFGAFVTSELGITRRELLRHIFPPVATVSILAACAFWWKVTPTWTVLAIKCVLGAAGTTALYGILGGAAQLRVGAAYLRRHGVAAAALGSR